MVEKPSNEQKYFLMEVRRNELLLLQTLMFLALDLCIPGVGLFAE